MSARTETSRGTKGVVKFTLLNGKVVLGETVGTKNEWFPVPEVTCQSTEGPEYTQLVRAFQHS